MAGATDYTLGDLLRRNAAMHGDAVAFRQDTRAITHRAHLHRVQQLAAGLRRRGIVSGERIAILSKNRIEYIELFGAAALLGAIVSPINWRLSPAEVLAVIENDTPVTIVVEDVFWPMLDLALARDGAALEPVTVGSRRDGVQCLDDLYADVRSSDESAQAPVSADAPLLLVHTAWTDGRPKAATLSHANLIANALQLQAAWQLGVDDVHLGCLPLFHSTAISLTLAVQLAGGASVLTRQFDPEEAAALTHRHRVTVLGEFAPMLDGLLNAAAANAPARLASLRHVCGLDSPETIRRFESVCPDATFWAGYGQTEVAGLVALGRFRDAPDAAGFPLALSAIAIEGEDGRLLPAGETGEIVVRGPCTCLGYWQRPEDNARLLRGGWLHTGDSGRLDAQGRLCYAGRLAIKELIKTGGENVYPSEVEAAIREHAGIADVAVVGVADAQWGESVKAVCVVRAGAAVPAPEEIADFVAGRIARYKRPRFVVFVEALPKQADGTVDRAAVRKSFVNAR